MVTTDLDRAGCFQTVQIYHDTVVEVASGKGQAQSTLISARDSAHDFSVKYSPRMCVAVDRPEKWLQFVSIYDHLLRTVLLGYMKVCLPCSWNSIQWYSCISLLRLAPTMFYIF